MIRRAVQPSTFGATYHSGFEDPRFAARARAIELPDRYRQPYSKGTLRVADEARIFIRVCRAALREPALLLFSSRGRHKPELLATVFISLWPRGLRPKIVLYGEMYEPDGNLRGAIERIIMRLADRAVRLYVVYSQADRQSFARTWNVDINRVRVCQFYTMRAGQDPPAAGPRGRHIFAGGDSFRHYEPLIEAARQLPEHEFVICTSRLAGRNELPPNVKAGPVPLAEYMRLMDTAAAVVVPLRVGLRRSTGMLTYLESMWAKKLTIVADALAVREYVRHKETGLVIEGSPAGYVEAIRWAFDLANRDAATRICEQAHREVCERFTLSNHVTCLLEVMDEALADASQAAGIRRTDGNSMED